MKARDGVNARNMLANKSAEYLPTNETVGRPAHAEYRADVRRRQDEAEMCRFRLQDPQN
ncbi:hypothetical protein [Bradyrhizobium sp. sGM-13]|uniref:hypothetical protein n=1 Tax=Bradyrhizobium sp. sGM-13 TaxID=2831781 RepID=UPI001BCC8187|nr:hypothetical protein [Bradyrhizobium sp. sGM-13]